MNGGLGNLGVSVMQLLSPVVIFVPIFTFVGVRGVDQPDGATLWLGNSPLIWLLLLAATVAAWFRMNDIAGAKTSIRDQLPVLKRPHMWLLSLLYLATFGSFIGFSAGFRDVGKTQFRMNILKLAFFARLSAPWRAPSAGIISDRLAASTSPRVNFILMALFTGLLFLTLPGSGSGSFLAFYVVFMGLFSPRVSGSGSTFQMIAVIFRQITIDSVKKRGGSDEQAQHEAVTDTAAALGFISAIGAVGGFFHPESLWHLLAMTGSPVGATKVFFVFMSFAYW